ncbi:MAG: ferrous iron transport protein B [Candidatus Zixiibacteriota bacterium]|nr:MAG: ferrous iron transport protein B [candidate division Zixibacteria bacterium]
MITAPGRSARYSGVVAICGNPNCGKTTIFNAMTGLNQQVGNYPGVTVERVSGRFEAPDNPRHKFTLVDIPGSYSLSAFTPDEYIAASVLFGQLEGEPSPDAVICVIDATRLERGLYLLLQIMQIGRPVVVALNMMDLARLNGIRVSPTKLSRRLGGIPVVPVVGNRRRGIDPLKREAARAATQSPKERRLTFDGVTEGLIKELAESSGRNHRSRAQYLRIIFDENGPAEREFIAREGSAAEAVLRNGRLRIREKHGSLVVAETQALTKHAEELYRVAVRASRLSDLTLSEKIDRYLLHPVLGPIVLILVMILVFQSIFTWAAPFMDMIDGLFSSLADTVHGGLGEGPLRSLLADGVIGGVGSVLVFIPQIAILFVFIALLEDSGYMPRAAFLVDRMFRWCGLSGKSFIPMLSSFACAIPGILATRTIEDRKLRFITILVAPLMTCSARLPVYAIMIAAFIPYKTYLGIFNLQGLVLTLLYLLGITAAVIVSFILKKTFLKAERGTFMMEMPSYKLPTLRSIGIRVFTRVKAFLIRAGTIILAITIIVWALSYYPRTTELSEQYAGREADLTSAYEQKTTVVKAGIAELTAGTPENQRQLAGDIVSGFERLMDSNDPQETRRLLNAEHPGLADLIEQHYQLAMLRLEYQAALTRLANQQAGERIRGSYLGQAGRRIEPLFKPLGWDWKVTVSVLAAFPAREVIIATLGTIYNLGSEIDRQSTSLIDKMRNAVWEEGPDRGKPVFSIPVALSIMVFFALCCQCGATLVTIRQETNRWAFSAFTFAYMTVLAYVSAMTVYQLLIWVGL